MEAIKELKNNNLTLAGVAPPLRKVILIFIEITQTAIDASSNIKNDSNKNNLLTRKSEHLFGVLVELSFIVSI
uniref:Uncharacterized protein n=1 Tax=Romanomermis culicivorax TaxID=13658 RepID=A0A915HG75_ROMCU